MEARSEEQPNDSGDGEAREQSAEPKPTPKLRDLRPEKDPVGAGNEAARREK